VEARSNNPPLSLPRWPRRGQPIHRRASRWRRPRPETRKGTRLGRRVEAVGIWEPRAQQKAAPARTARCAAELDWDQECLFLSSDFRVYRSLKHPCSAAAAVQDSLHNCSSGPSNPQNLHSRASTGAPQEHHRDISRPDHLVADIDDLLAVLDHRSDLDDCPQPSKCWGDIDLHTGENMPTHGSVQTSIPRLS